MSPSKMKTAIVLLLILAAGMGFGILGQRTPAQRQQETKPADAESKKKPPRLDLQGDPLPEGALARLGTVRMRHAHLISGAEFSSDAKSIIVSDYDSGVHVWDVAEGKELRRFYENDYACHRLALSPDGKTLAVALGNLSIRLCDPTSGREFGSLPPHDHRLYDMVFSHDGSLLATSTGEKSVRVWDLATRKQRHTVTFEANVGRIAFSPDDKILACGTSDGRCRLWDLAQGKEVGQLRDEPVGQHSLYAIYAPNGGPMAVWGYDDASIRLFDADGVEELLRFNKEGQTKSNSPWGWSSSIYASFSPNGRNLATFRDVGRIDLWDVASGKKLHTLPCGSSHHPSYLRFSPDGTKLASAGGDFWDGDGAVRVWDVAQGKELLPRQATALELPRSPSRRTARPSQRPAPTASFIFGKAAPESTYCGSKGTLAGGLKSHFHPMESG